MVTSTPYAVEQRDMVALKHAHMGGALTVYGIVRPGRLRWVGPWLPRLPLGWQDLWREMRPRKIRWGLALILAIVLFLLMGECGPTASLIAALP
jgi:hypothetical protein